MRFINHTKPKDVDNLFVDDIVLLRLHESKLINEGGIHPAKLVKPDTKIATNMQLVIAGWGLMENQEVSQTLLKADTILQPEIECKKRIPQFNKGYA